MVKLSENFLLVIGGVAAFRAARVLQQCVVLIEPDAEFTRDCGIAGVPAGACLDRSDRCRHLARTAVHRAWSPVSAAQLIDHRAANPDACKGFETGATHRLIAAGSLEQANHSGLNQILHAHRRRQPPEHMVSNAPHQRSMTLDQLSCTGCSRRIHRADHSHGLISMPLVQAAVRRKIADDHSGVMAAASDRPVAQVRERPARRVTAGHRSAPDAGAGCICAPDHRRG